MLIFACQVKFYSKYAAASFLSRQNFTGAGHKPEGLLWGLQCTTTTTRRLKLTWLCLIILLTQYMLKTLIQPKLPTLTVKWLLKIPLVVELQEIITEFHVTYNFRNYTTILTNHTYIQSGEFWAESESFSECGQVGSRGDIIEMRC